MTKKKRIEINLKKNYIKSVKKKIPYRSEIIAVDEKETKTKTKYKALVNVIRYFKKRKTQFWEFKRVHLPIYFYISFLKDVFYTERKSYYDLSKTIQVTYDEFLDFEIAIF